MAKQSKKSKKQGRDKIRCAAYFASGRQGVNKCKRLARVLVRNPNDADARRALDARDAYHVRARNELKDVGAKRAATVLGSQFNEAA